MLRDAAKIFDGPGLSSNTDYAVAAYKRIVMLEPGAPELDRLLDLLRERADVKTLIGVVTERLIWLESEGSEARHISMAPLLLERATVLPRRRCSFPAYGNRALERFINNVLDKSSKTPPVSKSANRRGALSRRRPRRRGCR